LLEACLEASSVRRVVITSSMAAITDEPDESHVLTERDWNDRSTLTRNPYYLSKTLAEKAAWAFVERERPTWDLIAINPFLVIGPSHTPALNTSNKVIADLLNGTYPGIISITWGVVDVRDVAAAHVLAMGSPEAEGRYLCVAGTMSMRAMVSVLPRQHDAYRLPRVPLDHAAGNLVVKAASYLQAPGVGQYLRTHVGRIPRFDASKIRRDLGLQFRTIEQSVLDAAADVIRWGHARIR
jgi:dihydroflavonol-4-reductase